MRSKLANKVVFDNHKMRMGATAPIFFVSAIVTTEL